MHFSVRSLSLVAGIVATAVVVGLVLFFNRGAEPVSAQPPEDSSAEPAVPTAQPSLAPEDQAKLDLEGVVRGYYAAENAAYLDPSTDPSAALDPYLRNPASGERVADILGFRNEGHQLQSSSAEVHSVEITQLDLVADPATATIEECHTLAAAGIDGETGQPASFNNRRKTVWTAQTLADGSWRLKTYETGGVGSC